MSTVRDIEQAIRDLPEDELRQFRQWFADFDARLWDAEFEQDVADGHLDEAADKALRERREGRTRPL